MTQARSIAQRLLPTAGTFALVAVGLFVVGLLLDLFWLRVSVKAFPVLALITWVVAKAPRGRMTGLVGLGLGLCVIADILLEFRDTLFLPGVAVFLLGHLAYIAGFVTDERGLRLHLAIPFAFWGVTLFTVLQPGLGDMTLPIAVYATAICVMMWRAAARVEATGGAVWEPWLTLAGAVAFALSDSMIALDRFHAPIEGSRYPIILLYWGGQLLIARSTLSSARGEGQPAQATSPPRR
ncbi:MAG: hypothetical protein CMH57_15455 [Myxococcales bacterium]|nr:hypothetical protein [Myxococcales bacterium]